MSDEEEKRRPCSTLGAQVTSAQLIVLPMPASLARKQPGRLCRGALESGHVRSLCHVQNLQIDRG